MNRSSSDPASSRAESRSRAAPRQRDIADWVRERIVSGRLKPGGQLPLRSELVDRFDASSLTVQRALDALVRDGFVTAHRRRGTFVAERPPHLYGYAVVFRSSPQDTHWQFDTALVSEAESVSQQSPRTVASYFNIDGHEDVEDYQQLLADVRFQRLAGLVFVGPPGRVHDSPLVQAPGFGRVTLLSAPDAGGMPAVHVDQDAFYRKSIEALAAEGRKRLAVLAVSNMNAERRDEHATRIGALASKLGMTFRPAWFQGTDPRSLHWAYHCAQLLMDAPTGRRPDALIISDDNLVPHASAGLAAAGLTFPEDLGVIGFANFPYPTPQHVPMRRCGLPVRELLDHALDNIDRQRAGRRVAPLERIEPRFESDATD